MIPDNLYKTTIQDPVLGQSDLLLIESEKLILESEPDEFLTRNRKRTKVLNKITEKRLRFKKNATIKGKNGWKNILILLSCLFIGKYIVVNIIENGFIMKMPFSGISKNDLIWFFVCLFIIFIRSCFFNFLVNSRNASFIFGIFNIIFYEYLNSMIASKKIRHIFLNSWTYTLSLAYNMKLYSFLYNYQKINEKKTFKEFINFLIYPTLLYKAEYKTKTIIDYDKIRKSIMKILLLLPSMCFVIDQHAVPAIIKLTESTTTKSFIDGFIQLSISSIILFLLFFILFFECTMTILSELSGFDEKLFSDWWNSRTVGEFWRNWNLPVHEFMKFHIYNPLVENNYGKTIAMLACFLFSGFVHEYVVSMTLRFFNGWFLYGMLVQIPLYYITNIFKEKIPSLANLFFWFCFSVIGQPIGVYLICRGHYYKNELNLIFI